MTKQNNTNLTENLPDLNAFPQHGNVVIVPEEYISVSEAEIKSFGKLEVLQETKASLLKCLQHKILRMYEEPFIMRQDMDFAESFYKQIRDINELDTKITMLKLLDDLHASQDPVDKGCNIEALGACMRDYHLAQNGYPHDVFLSIVQRVCRMAFDQLFDNFMNEFIIKPKEASQGTQSAGSVTIYDQYSTRSPDYSKTPVHLKPVMCSNKEA